MTKKIFTIGLIICSFLVATMNIALAVSTTTLTDDANDVIDLEGNEVNNKGYLDIKELVCSRDYRKVTLKLTVDDSIVNKGNIIIYRLIVDEEFFNVYTASMTEEEINETLIEMAQQDLVTYSFEISTTDDNLYSVFYINNEVLVFDQNFTIIDGLKSVSGNTLIISFNLLSSKEKLVDVTVNADESSELTALYFQDNEGLYGEVSDTDESNGGNNGGSSNDGGSGLTLFVVLIVIIIIAGVAVVIYIVRR